MRLTIKITKEVLERSMFCSPLAAIATTNCAIALAVRDIFPEARTMHTYISPWPYANLIFLPTEASLFITTFDGLSDRPEERLNIPEFSFEIEVPDEVIEKIGIEEAKEIISKSSTLELA